MGLLRQPASTSVLGYLGQVSDPRHRQGRVYPLGSLLGLLVLASLHGASSLRGMWVWARAHWSQIGEGLGFPGRPPALATLWYVLARLQVDALEEALGRGLQPWLALEPQGWSVDGKVLRGSRRRGAAALAMVTMAGHHLRGVLAQQPVEGQDEVQAALALLARVPLAGRVVTLDAGLVQPQVLQRVRAGGGDYVGVVKGNHPEVKEAVDLWLRERLSPSRRAAVS